MCEYFMSVCVFSFELESRGLFVLWCVRGVAMLLSVQTLCVWQYWKYICIFMAFIHSFVWRILNAISKRFSEYHLEVIIVAVVVVFFRNEISLGTEANAKVCMCAVYIYVYMKWLNKIRFTEKNRMQLKKGNIQKER